MNVCMCIYIYTHTDEWMNAHICIQRWMNVWMNEEGKKVNTSGNANNIHIVVIRLN